MRAQILMLAAVAGCANPASSACGAGVFCAEGLVCDVENDRCLTPDQATACELLADGDRCVADGRGARCQLGACLPACGDGVLDAGEQCDDNNDASHDGCSSGCLVETQSWVEWESLWRPRSGHALAYDSDRNRVVVFGGYDDGTLGDTWERIEDGAGTTWKPVLVGGPSPRADVAMAYDPVRKRVVLFGGHADTVLGDTWEWNGSTWEEKQLDIRPPPRREHAMAFDPSIGKVVLFGGLGASTEYGDTWIYDGVWTQIALTGGPGPRSGVAMAYAPDRGAVVIFGGSVFGTTSETYELKDLAWSRTATTGPQPPTRRGAAMTFANPLQGPSALVMYGGRNGNAVLGDAWTYRNGEWSAVSYTVQPPPTYSHALVSVPDLEHPGEGKLVLVGGRSESERFAATWSLGAAANTWVPRLSPVSPPTQQAPAATDGNGLMTLFGEDGALWQFDGRSWLLASTSRSEATNRYGFAFDYVPTRGAHVMFGGADSTQGGEAAETWEIDASGARLLPLAASPPACVLCAAAYDATRQVLVLVGDGGATWELGATWLQGPDLPAGMQSSAALAYDPREGAVILVANDGATWRYDGAWTNLGVPVLAGGRAGAAMAYDRLRGELLLFGGLDVAQNFDTTTRRLTATGWEPLALGGEPPPGRRFHALAFVRGQGLVMFGGKTSVGQQRGDTWLLQSLSATPDEVCDDGVDNDGDTRVDAADPDC